MKVETGNTWQLMSCQKEIERVSNSLRAMAHPMRLKILRQLGDNEISVLKIAESLGESQSTISQHLSILKGKDILASRKEGNRVYYRVGDSRMLQFVNTVLVWPGFH